MPGTRLPPTSRRLGPFALLVLGLIATACAPDDQILGSVRGEWRSESEVVGDTTIVRTTSGSLWGDTMYLVPELEIGELEGPDALLFGRVSGLEVDGEGRLLVVDAQAQEVRRFSATGEHTLTLGGPGEGPGEFSTPDQVRVLSDGRILVRDLAGRFSVFGPDGDYRDGWLRGTGHITSAPFHLTDQGDVLNPSLPDRLLSYGLDGTVRDTLPMPTRGHSPENLRVSMGGGVAYYPIPFMPEEHWTMDRAGRVIFGVGDRYAVERWETDGGVLRIERLAPPEPVLDDEARQLREQTTRSIRRFNDPEWSWDGPGIPSTKPIFQGILAGIDGSIWVLREQASIPIDNPDWDPSEPDRGFPTRWERSLVADVFDAEGRYLGPVKAPASMRWLFPHAVVSEDAVWAVTQHDLGYPQVVRYRVAGEAPDSPGDGE